MFEREYRELSFVPRWPILRRIKEQSVAEHSYYVALYAGQVADFVQWPETYRSELLDQALRHDLDEVFTSDIPGPAKRAIVEDRHKFDAFTHTECKRRFGLDYEKRSACGLAEDNNNIYNEINLIIKVADLMDEVFYLATEQQLGNRAVGDVCAHSFERLLKAWHALCDKLDVDHGIRYKGTVMLDETYKRHISTQSIVITG